jgi:hypothetical protein
MRRGTRGGAAVRALPSGIGVGGGDERGLLVLRPPRIERYDDRGARLVVRGRGVTHRLRLSVLPGLFAVCRLDPTAEVPPEMARAPLVSITRTRDELSIVCEEPLAPVAARCERGWRCLALEGPIPFTTTGVFASLATPLADASVGIFAISTFDTDFLLVKDEQLPAALAALAAAGHHVSS